MRLATLPIWGVRCVKYACWFPNKNIYCWFWDSDLMLSRHGLRHGWMVSLKASSPGIFSWENICGVSAQTSETTYEFFFWTAYQMWDEISRRNKLAWDWALHPKGIGHSKYIWLSRGNLIIKRLHKNYHFLNSGLPVVIWSLAQVSEMLSPFSNALEHLKGCSVLHHSGLDVSLSV